MKRYRPVPYELEILRILNPRMDFSEKEMFDYINAEKGFEGELKFDQLTNKLQGELIVLNDLLLKLGNTYYQIDTTIIRQSVLHFFEVKNYEGDYFLESGELFKMPSKREVKSPFNQLERSESLMRRLLQQNGFNISVKGLVAFVNPEFSLFQAPLDLPVILPSQLKRFMKNLDKQPSRLNEFHRHLAERLISLHQEKCPYTQLPSYEFEQLKKRITCQRCFHFMLPVANGKGFICMKCEYKEGVESAILRQVKEYKLLFPERKITTHDIFVWCGGYVAESTIRKYLKMHYKFNGFGRWAYFE